METRLGDRIEGRCSGIEGRDVPFVAERAPGVVFTTIHDPGNGMYRPHAEPSSDSHRATPSGFHAECSRAGQGRLPKLQFLVFSGRIHSFGSPVVRIILPCMGWRTHCGFTWLVCTLRELLHNGGSRLSAA
jgi:hypothetical protein